MNIKSGAPKLCLQFLNIELLLVFLVRFILGHSIMKTNFKLLLELCSWHFILFPFYCNFMMLTEFFGNLSNRLLFPVLPIKWLGGSPMITDPGRLTPRLLTPRLLTPRLLAPRLHPFGDWPYPRLLFSSYYISFLSWIYINIHTEE